MCLTTYQDRSKTHSRTHTENPAKTVDLSKLRKTIENYKKENCSAEIQNSLFRGEQAS